MEISITYCVQWDYRPNAVSLAERIKSALGIEVQLIKGSRGIVDVMVDGELLYSKYQTGCFPEEQQLVNLLQSR